MKRYIIRRATNAAINGIRMAHRATSEGIRSESDVACICAVIIRVLTPLVGILLFAIVAMAI